MHHRYHSPLILLSLLAILLLAACAQNRYLYYGDSSQSYYAALKNPDKTEAYQRSLEDVFRRSADKGLPVPPGLYCEYAMLRLQDGDRSTAREYLLKEREQWPESAQLVNLLLAKYSLQP